MASAAAGTLGASVMPFPNQLDATRARVPLLPLFAMRIASGNERCKVRRSVNVEFPAIPEFGFRPNRGRLIFPIDRVNRELSYGFFTAYRAGPRRYQLGFGGWTRRTGKGGLFFEFVFLFGFGNGSRDERVLCSFV